jgi:hypothetical protein
MPRPVPMPATHMRCLGDCNTVKPLEEFAVTSARGRRYRRRVCRACMLGYYRGYNRRVGRGHAI